MALRLRNTLVSLVAGAAGSIPQAVTRILMSAFDLLAMNLVVASAQRSTNYTNAGVNTLTTVVSLSIDVESTADLIAVMGRFSGEVDAASTQSFVLKVDGGTWNGGGSFTVEAGSGPVIATVGATIIGLSPGTHLIELQADTSAGTLSCIASGALEGAQLTAIIQRA